MPRFQGGGWEALDWSPNDRQLLVMEVISANESYLWLIDVVTGEKTLITPKGAAEKVDYGNAQFSKDGKGIYVRTDRESEFQRLAYVDLKTKKHYFLTELGIGLIFPNVRGSSGYGKTFLKLDNGFLREDSYKDIGALLDWIKTRPDLDANRIMVTGGSYGGHMTLAVATYYPDRISCALDKVGPSNLVTLLENTSAYRRDLRRVEYGDERNPKMREFLNRIAPLNNAARITKPLFVVQGRNDPRVPLSESVQMVATIRKNGTPVWYLMASDEGHGFAKKKNRDFLFYSSVLFVKEYLLK